MLVSPAIVVIFAILEYKNMESVVLPIVTGYRLSFSHGGKAQGEEGPHRLRARDLFRSPRSQ